MKASLEAFSQFSATNHWLALWPVLSLALLAMLVLALDMFWASTRRRVVPVVTVVGQLALLVTLIGRAAGCWELAPLVDNPQDGLFSGMIVQTVFSGYMEIFFVLSSLLVTYLGMVYLKRQNLPRTEFFALVMIISAALILLVNSANFVLLFVALETVTIGFYVLVAYCRYNTLSLEAGLKYLIMGGLSSSILLFGIVLLYGASGNPSYEAFTRNGMDFSQLAAFISANSTLPLVRIGAVMVICGILFKIGAVPFQIWIPDVYQGAPTPVTAFLAIGSKAAGVAILINLLVGPFAQLGSLLVPLLGVVAAVTILFGNFAALTEVNAKRMMGLSGVSHAGFLLVGVAALLAGSSVAAVGIVVYLFSYLFASFLGFTIMAHLASDKDTDQLIANYRGLGRSEPFLAGMLTVAVASLAGIPPLVGFIGKLFIFVAAFQAGLFWLIAVAIVGVVLSIYYYFGWIRAMWFAPDAGAESAEVAPVAEVRVIGLRHRFLMAALAVITVVLGLFQFNLFS